jgi:hypothetical protein
MSKEHILVPLLLTDIQSIEKIQNMECKQMQPILIKHHIIGYYLYVDDILLIYNQREANRGNLY